ncbi:MAG: type II/IV secretion system protein [Rubrivivax sp.]|nr:MAG: type II/IV secretion system protein [Rubrivivax sp.]
MNLLSMDQLVQWTPALDKLALADCARHRCGFVTAGDDRLGLLITDPSDQDRIAWARSLFDVHRVHHVAADTFDAWIAHCESSAQGRHQGMAGLQHAAMAAQDNAEVLSLSRLGSDESPAVRLVNATLYEALKAGASDIHLESDAQGMMVKFRMDGVLNLIQRVDGIELATQAISRIKVMAQLDIAERRVPQDGRLQIVLDQRPVDVRVSIMPSIHGEDAVLRILDRRHLADTLAGLTLAKLGFDAETVPSLHRLCRKPHGMLLVTGPTGSGKTTTLYAAISETHHTRDKIITIEDPVEYHLQGVLQIPVNERKGLTFARGLRSILRHDPDKILIGEIRDAETAQIAVQSALTGHLVFTTVHANNVFDVLGRFQQFDIDAYMFGAAINGILAQRLVRKVCTHCAMPDRDMPAGYRSAGAGCEHCRGTGYSGRLALGELLVMNNRLKALFASRAGLPELEAEALNAGWRPLRDQAVAAAAQGITTMEEVDRVAS